MIAFLFKGILRDRSRSTLPIIVVAIGVMLTVFLSGYMPGVMGGMTDQTARFATGHVKVTTQAYAENIDQLPNDLAILGISDLKANLQSEYPEFEWAPRIQFGGLIDVPGPGGSSKAQGPATGTAIDLISDTSGEIDRMNIREALQSGEIPSKQGEVLLGHDLAEKMGIALGDTLTYFGNSMHGSMSFYALVLSGTVRFGMPAMDRTAMLLDLSDAQHFLDMEDGSGEILGFFKDEVYDDKKAGMIAEHFNKRVEFPDDEFSPLMKSLREQNNLGGLMDYGDRMSTMIVIIFVISMSVVLWNTGLLSGLRRYNEFGIRLALGEAKGQIYKTLLMESLLVGLIGSFIGTLLGLAAVYYMEKVGYDISDVIENTTMMMPSVMRAKMSPSLFFIGFIPGVLAMVLGTALSGRGIYTRETAQLFKELEI